MDTEAIRAWAAGFTDAKAHVPVEPGSSLSMGLLVSLCPKAMGVLRKCR